MTNPKPSFSMSKGKKKESSLFKDMDMSEKQLDELWTILEPLQCLNCGKELTCNQCDFNKSFDRLIKYIIRFSASQREKMVEEIIEMLRLHLKIGGTNTIQMAIHLLESSLSPNRRSR